RRDMSRKEEYEFLELNPFCDLAEFSARHPHVHQRTYYRWKRRIKEEFMVLEQCPDMSFAQFSGVVLQAKENVFSLWKSLIAQGKGFFALPDSSKRLDSKLSSCQATTIPQEQQLEPQTAESLFLQKNLSATFLDFSQRFPRGSLNVFNSLKQKSIHEFSLFHQNKHMSFHEFSKLVNIPEEVFKEWQSSVQSLSHFQGSASNIPNSLHSLQSLAHVKALDTNGFHHKNLQLSLASAMKHQLGGEQSLLPGLSESVSHNLSASYLASLQNLIPTSLASISQHSPRPAESEGIQESQQSIKNVKPALSPVHSHHHSDKEEVGDLSTAGALSRSRKQNLQEYIHFLSRPGLGFRDLVTLFPGISSRTFYRWRKEMNAAVLLVGENPDMEFAHFQAVFPDIPEEIFCFYKAKFDFVSPSTFELWLTKIRAVVVDILSNPSMDYKDFNIKDMSPDLFEKLRNLQPQDLAMIEESCQAARAQYDATINNCQTEEQRSIKISQKAFEYLQTHPSISWEAFHAMYSIIPFDVFQNWTDTLSSQISYLKDKPDLTYSEFTKLFPHTSQKAFQCLRKDSCSPSLQNPTNHFLSKHQINNEQDKHSEMMTVSAKSPLDGKLCPRNLMQFEEDDEAFSSQRQKKMSRAEYMFVKANPEVDSQEFSRIFPGVSARTFYRWKKEI
ncbi:hypothetical protein EGW08_012258, partial [Elysia chlorotica]